MGAPLGNVNRNKGISLINAIQAACHQDGSARLRQGVNVLLQRFADKGGIREAEFIRDTLDGRPTQQVSLTDQSDTLTSLQVLFVDAAARLAQSREKTIEHEPVPSLPIKSE